ncbi:hypothetical protein H9Q72_011213 [Fusarium xylarioides]|uniref:Uncharacterized protein n=1 Tax=Fusarium xylarioides TaxID=221167 RepID=A0A9P7L4E3_9HYPO|nr:hypothetical protein H9Q70_011485 [Fusarium xylarioides]KAG5760670.1 hypothetical protein H9Q72_011213 [Fusarium xylarioides]KAG5774754.1 hypothetical protein H9Q73_011583 [Fusarium xylarioides]
MPLPKSDEEIMAGWSAQEREFWDWTEKNKNKILDTQRYGAEWNAYQKLMKQAWPDHDILEKYEEWAYNWHRRFFVRNKHIISTRDFIDMVSQTNFLDSDNVEKVYHNIRIYDNSLIAIGETNFGGVVTGYAFMPEPGFLEPKHTDSDPDVVGNDILAMNIHIPYSPSLSRTSSVRSFDTGSVPSLTTSSTLSRTLSELSIRSQPLSFVSTEDSIDARINSPGFAMHLDDFQTLRGIGMGFNNGPSSVFGSIRRKNSQRRGAIPIFPPPERESEETRSVKYETLSHNFVFAQLGMLWVYNGKWESIRGRNPADAKPGRWKPNGFAVVVRLSPKGKPGEVYAICHPNPRSQLKKIEDDYISEADVGRLPRSEFKRGCVLKYHRPGHLHVKSKSPFWLAKIADSMQELGSFEREFEFDIISLTELQIVNAKIWDYGLDGRTLVPVRELEDIDQ